MVLPISKERNREKKKKDDNNLKKKKKKDEEIITHAKSVFFYTGMPLYQTW